MAVLTLCGLMIFRWQSTNVSLYNTIMCTTIQHYYVHYTTTQHYYVHYTTTQHYHEHYTNTQHYYVHYTTTQHYYVINTLIVYNALRNFKEEKKSAI